MCLDQGPLLDEKPSLFLRANNKLMRPDCFCVADKVRTKVVMVQSMAAGAVTYKPPFNHRHCTRQAAAPPGPLYTSPRTGVQRSHALLIYFRKNTQTGFKKISEKTGARASEGFSPHDLSYKTWQWRCSATS